MAAADYIIEIPLKYGGCYLHGCVEGRKYGLHIDRCNGQSTEEYERIKAQAKERIAKDMTDDINKVLSDELKAARAQFG